MSSKTGIFDKIGIIRTGRDTVEVNPHQLPRLVFAALVRVGTAAVNENAVSCPQGMDGALMSDAAAAAFYQNKEKGVQTVSFAQMTLVSSTPHSTLR